MATLTEPLAELFSSARVVILDFSQIKDDTPREENIQLFFEHTIKQGENPRLPYNRQRFNNTMLEKTRARYLVGRYGEDRAAMLTDTIAGKEGRTIHMGIDIFSKDLEPLYAPAAGTIVRSGHEPGFGEYGNYMIFQPEQSDIYLFFGHLSSSHPELGKVEKGQAIGRLGDYANDENGGWSRHLHVQILTELPPEAQTPIGYSTRADFADNGRLFPNPLEYFSDWHIAK